MDITTALLTILLAPLASAVVIILFFRKQGAIATVVSVFAAFVIMFFSLRFLLQWDGTPVHPSLTWFDLGGWNVKMGFYIDNYAATMILVVSVVAFLIHLFSVSYMSHDDSRGRYFAGLSIFMFSMMGIVLSDNLIMLFVFWELVGFSSYALIAHYKNWDEARDASKKAFIVNRVGDFGFLLGIVGCYWHYGTVDLIQLREIVIVNPSLIIGSLGFLLMCGFLGKSAQFPLQVWLPDAMAGPTPVSALIHAATMVAAGIYFLIRIYFLLSADVLHVIMWLGAIMTAYAGFCALAQNDIKKILAYSTLSQLGYMATAVGLGYPGLALFHLGTHACFKALLFLGAGSVIHATDHQQDIFKMGGLFARMPITGFTFGIGLIALCGVTFTSGYFSKDAIIEAAYFSNTTIFWLILFSVFLTSLYMGRLFWVAFLGKANTEQAREACESSFVMTFPLIVLAVLSIFAGYVAIWPSEWSASFDFELMYIHHSLEGAGVRKLLLLYTTLAWVLGLGLSYLFYGRVNSSDALEKKVPGVYNFLKSKLWFDEIYNFYVLNIQQRFANLLGFLDTVLVSGIMVRGSAGIVGLLGLASRALHIGSIHGYVYWFLLGVIFFGLFAISWI